MSFSLSGFSGMDTESIVQQMMQVERRPIQRMQLKQQEINKKIDGWQEINSSLDTLKNKANELQDVFSEMAPKSSNEDVLTATAVSEANKSSYDIDVTKLAKSNRIASGREDDTTSSLNLNGGAGGEFTVKLGTGENFNVSVDGSDSLNNVKDAINTAAGNDDGSGNRLVEASIVDNTLIMKSAKTGNDQIISFTDTNGILENDLGFKFEAASEPGDVKATGESLLQEASNANFTVDGLEVNRSSNNIDDVIDGVTLDLKDTGSSTLEIAPDKEGMSEKMKAFVEQYNKVRNTMEKYGGEEGRLQGDFTLSSLENKLYNATITPSTTVSSEEYLSSNPLSGAGTLNITVDENTETVNFNGSETLEEITSKIDGTNGVSSYVEDGRVVIESNTRKAVDLSGSDSQMLTDLKLPQNFEKNTATLMGIDVNDDGTLTFNESKFNDAIENNITSLKQMFGGVNGIVDRIDQEVNLAVDSFDGYLTGRIDTLENEIDYLDDSIESQEERLEMREESLRSQFARMEEMVSKYQSQGDWMSSQISQMGLA